MTSEPLAETGHERLHIFVNRRRFEEGDGVRPKMTGADIALLVEVPQENAIVREQEGDDLRDIGIDVPIAIHNGDHFIVTRKIVEGGYEPRAH